MGLAGGADRCRWVLDTLGIDACLDYRADDFTQRLRDAFPAGIDLFSDGVGGWLTEAVCDLINRGGRLFAYGGGANFYADTLSHEWKSPSIRRAFGISERIEAALAARNVRLECWIVDAFYHQRLEAEDALSTMMLRGEIKPMTNVVDGFDHLPAAIADLYRRPRAGKLQVRISRELPARRLD